MLSQPQRLQRGPWSTQVMCRSRLRGRRNKTPPRPRTREGVERPSNPTQVPKLARPVPDAVDSRCSPITLSPVTRAVLERVYGRFISLCITSRCVRVVHEELVRTI